MKKIKLGRNFIGTVAKAVTAAAFASFFLNFPTVSSTILSVSVQILGDSTKILGLPALFVFGGVGAGLVAFLALIFALRMARARLQIQVAERLIEVSVSKPFRISDQESRERRYKRINALKATQNVRDSKKTASSHAKVAKASSDAVPVDTLAVSSDMLMNGLRQQIDEHETQSIRTPLFATVVSGVTTSRLGIVCLALLACFFAELMAYSTEFVELTNTTRYWFYGIASVAALDCVLAKVRHYAGGYGSQPVELVEVATEISKHVDPDGGPGSGTHFYVDAPLSKGAALETAPNVQGGVVS